MSRCASRPLSLGLLAALLASSMAAQATQVVNVTALDTWYNFSVDPTSTADRRATWINLDYATTAIAGNAEDLVFNLQLSQAAELRVVDIYTAGDTYALTITGANGSLHTSTSSVPELGLDNAFADTPADAWSAPAQFSRGSWVLGPGQYTVSGSLLQSVSGSGGMTSGALQITAVPEPSGWSMAAAGLALVVWLLRRQPRA